MIQCVHGGANIGKALVGHSDIDGLLFTGSANAGIAINKKLASDPGKIVALEMGGNNPIIALPTPKIEDAAATIIQSAFTTAGQRCTAARRLIVPDEFYDVIVPAVSGLAERLLVDEPFAEPQPFMGTVIDNEAADLLLEARAALLDHGGEDVVPMERLQDDLPFLSPGMIDVTAIDERPDIELFGPLLQIIRVADFDAAIAEANDTRYGLAASLIGGEPGDFERFWNEARAGIVNWNRPTNGASSAAPFGGIGLSGNHRPAAYYCRRLLRISCRLHRNRPAALQHRRRPSRWRQACPQAQGLSYLSHRNGRRPAPVDQGSRRRPLRPREGRPRAAGGRSPKLVSVYPQRVLLRSMARPSKAPAAPPRIAPSVRSPPRPASSWPISAPTPAPTRRPVVPSFLRQ